jgi:hypothetical protein
MGVEKSKWLFKLGGMLIFGSLSQSEQVCWDPKDGELCSSRAKPEETLVEARRGFDVQINRRTWV